MTTETLRVVNPDEYKGTFKQAVRQYSALPFGQIAKRAGMSPSQMTFYTTGKLLPSPKTARRIAAALGITFEEFRQKIVMRDQHGLHPHLHVFGEECRTEARKRFEDYQDKTRKMQRDGYRVEDIPEYHSDACNNVHIVHMVGEGAGFSQVLFDRAYFAEMRDRLLLEPDPDAPPRTESYREREEALFNLEMWQALDDTPEILVAHEKERAECAANKLPMDHGYVPAWRAVLVIEVPPVAA